MNLRITNDSVSTLNFNGFSVETLIYNGEIVWRKGSEPASSYDYQVAKTYQDLTVEEKIPYSYVYNDSKWYALNNLNQYEEWGIIEETDDINTITTYPNKLALQGNSEYEYSNNQWNYLGEKEGFAVNYPIKLAETVTQTFPLKNFRLTYSTTGAKNFTITSTTSDYNRLVVTKNVLALTVTLYDNDGRSYKGSVKTITSRKDYEVTFDELDDNAVIVSDAITSVTATAVTATYSASTASYPKQYDNSIFNDYNLYNGYYYSTEDDIEYKGKNIIYNIDGYLYQNEERTTINPYNLYSELGNYGTLSGSSITEIKLLDENIDVIGDYAFQSCNSLTNIEIPDSVTSIGTNAFKFCYSLTNIEIPNSVTSIGTQAFRYCSSLTSVTIPNNLTTISDDTFQGCNNLTVVLGYGGDAMYRTYPYKNNIYISSVTFDNSITTIGTNAFKDSFNIKKVEIPNSVKSIDSNAFQSCSGLTSVTIPNSVKSIGSTVFYGCSSLTNIEIPNSVVVINPQTFYGCTSLTSVTIPNSVTSIGDEAFLNCTSLTSVTIPNGVTSIHNQTFYGCSSLTSVTIPNSVTSIGNIAFDGVPTEGTLYCDETWYSNLTEEQITNLGNVYNWTRNPQPTIPNNEIWYTTSTNLSAQTQSVTGEKSLQSMGLISNTYENGKGIMKFSKNVTSIGDEAFYTLSKLTSVTLPNSVTSIGSYAFLNDVALTSIEIPSGVTSIGYNAFGECYGLTSIEIPDSVTSIGEYAFQGCRGLTSVIIGNSVTTIGTYAFGICPNITSVTIGSGVTSIGAYAFAGTPTQGTLYCDDNWYNNLSSTNIRNLGNVYNWTRNPQPTVDGGDDSDDL